MRTLATLRKFPEQFWKYVASTSPGTCWLWIGATAHEDPRAYFWLDGKSQPAYRVAYQLLKGTIPDGMFACHSCDKPLCVNPEHIWIGTSAQNQEDMARKGRSASGSRHGSKTRPEQWKKGERHPNARLTWEQVRRIRQLHATGAYTANELNGMFNTWQVPSILSNKTWKEQGGHTVIVFEGPERVGKSTQLKRLAKALRARGRTVTELHTSITLGKDVTRIKAHKTVKFFLYLAAIQEATLQIREEIAKGHDVLLDRYTYSNIAFVPVMGLGDQTNAALEIAIKASMAFASSPDLVVYIDGKQFGKDWLTESQKNMLREEYRSWLPPQTLHVNNNRSAADMHKTILETVDKLCRMKGEYNGCGTRSRSHAAR